MHKALRGFGVDDRFVTDVPGLPTPVTFCEIFPPDHFPLYFYRLPKAPDLEIARDELDLEAIGAADIFWATVTGLSQEPSRDRDARGPGDAWWQGNHDPGSRLPPDVLARTPGKATDAIAEALPLVDVAVGNREECEVAVGETEPAAAAAALRAEGIRVAIVKQGPDGVLAVDETGEVQVPPAPVNVVNGQREPATRSAARCATPSCPAGTWPRASGFGQTRRAGAIVAGRLACSGRHADEQQEVDSRS